MCSREAEADGIRSRPRVWIALGASVMMLGLSPVEAEPGLNFDHDQSLVGVDFSDRQDLAMAIFTKANCRGANFTKVSMENANIEDVNFIEANLSGANMRGVFATKTRFSKAKLDGAILEGANLVGAVFDGASIDGADFTEALIEPFQVMCGVSLPRCW